MPKIIRTPSYVAGGITPEESLALAKHADKWIANARSTEPVDPARLIPAVHALYSAAGLKQPRVVIVPSPQAMAFAGGFAAAIWWAHKNGMVSGLTASTAASMYEAVAAAVPRVAARAAATAVFTLNATEAAIHRATVVATAAATGAATDLHTREATDKATEAAVRRATREATREATEAATRRATYAATREATEASTDELTRRATEAATHHATAVTISATIRATEAAVDAAVRKATGVATEVATYDATAAATHHATEAAINRTTAAATHHATEAAINRTTAAATEAAVDAAVRKATGVATEAAIREATLRATEIATYAAEDAAVGVATIRATHMATYLATEAATRTATEAAVRRATEAATGKATSMATTRATLKATYEATEYVTEAAVSIWSSTDAATHEATETSTYEGTLRATSAGEHFGDLAQQLGRRLGIAPEFLLSCARSWSRMYQGGNMWSAWVCRLSAFRDVLGLELPEYAKYKAWEDCAIEGGFRLMHDEFCIVSDRPEILKYDNEGRPHCETGPSHKWRDGWSLYHWHGVAIPGEWVCGEKPTAAEALTWPDIEQRRAACEIVGWVNILDQLSAKVIDKHENDEIGTLLEVRLPDSGLQRFLSVVCGTGRRFALPVDNRLSTAIAAQAWTYDIDPADFDVEVRT